MEELRQPVVVVLGHVDSGKTSLLDKIRGTAVQAREAGGITQHIGASFFPTDTLKQICGPLLSRVGGEVAVPGLLVIDTPGHEVFTNLRSRGGSAADISILVVDSAKGFEVQTYESIDILRSRRVPFVVALNKIDLMTGWRRGPDAFVTKSISVQAKQVQDELDERIYTVVGAFSQLGFRSEAFYRIKDFTKEIAIVPVSAKTGEGIPELIAVLIGLTQQYLKRRLTVTAGHARGIVLEVSEEPGLGVTASTIILDGILKVGDHIVAGKREGAFVTRVKGIFMPKPLDEMRDPRDKFTPISEAKAAAGVKIVASDLEGVLAGSPIVGVEDPDRAGEAKATVYGEVNRVFIKTDHSGVVLKADTLGSLEALVDILKSRGVPIRLADIGPLTKRDVIEAETVAEKDRYHGVALVFNVKILPDAEEEISERGVKVFSDPVIYRLIEGYLTWAEDERETAERLRFESLTLPASFRILKGFTFRRSDPAIFGVEVLTGRLKQKAEVINSEGRTVGAIHGIQHEGKGIREAAVGSQVAVSMNEPTVGRQIHEGEVLYTLPKEDEVKLLLERFTDRLTPDEVEALNKIIGIRRRVNPTYAF